MNIPSRIFLVGFMGCGKSTVGRRLAERLSRRFIDLDDWIVERAGRPIARIFAEQGEAVFRELESELLCESIKIPEVVISLGGGAFVSETNRRIVQQHGLSIWLDCSFDVLLKRVEESTDRPLFKSPDQLRALLESRLPSYARADYRIDAGNASTQDVVEKILEHLSA